MNYKTKKTSNVSVIIVAAGSGSRFIASSVPKAFYPIRRMPMILYSLNVFEQCSLVSEVIVVLKKDLIGVPWKKMVGKRTYSKIKAIVPGGATRSRSVQEGVRVVNQNAECILIHDAARPFLSQRLIRDVIEKAIFVGAAVPGIPVTSTLKEIDENACVVKTHERGRFRAIQTPQAFRRELLEEAYRTMPEEMDRATDEACLIEWMGKRVIVVNGEEQNIKITTEHDLIVAKAYFNHIKSKHVLKGSIT
ncbi:MAG: 2-C-methyl-D-erythritol 4-phosphate cytidylyltransferase [Chlamydiota bacterium]|nr:2-C-methyl-D-erythritol 4-phosphate cytidylyltransferase [Chlamydiota bacterium]